MRWILTALAALATLATISAAITVAGQNPPPPQPPPTFKTEANYVRVDVFPTRDGRPILDLRQDEFEVLENGVPQKIDAFEHVLVRAAGPQETRHEPNTVAESRAALENPRARVFVVFLDVYHVEVGGSHNIRKPLIDTLNRVIGQEDLVGVMTPEMSAGDVTFARRTTTIEGMLTRYWTWGERDQINTKDPEEQQYLTCYPGNGPTPACPDDDRGVAKEMIYRRREKRTIDALEDLVRFLRGAREERKAVIAITDGWRLYRPNPGLERRLNCQVPTGPSIGTDPRTGKLSAGDPTRNPYGAIYSSCDRDRLNLARIDDADEFRRILDEANRANTSFYPVDPRGLAVFDEQIMPPIPDSTGSPAPMVPLTVDANLLRARLDSLRTLAAATDGIAVINSNDLNAGLKRVVDDLTSYYLIGYYTTGKLDGKFHSITVRVKRPDVQVRARRGYLAPTAAEVAAAKPTAPPSPAEAAAAAEKEIVNAALAPLGKFQRDSPLSIRVAAGWKPGHSSSAAVWVVGELSGAAAFAREWAEGATADIVLKADDGSATGTTVATTRVKIDPGSRSFRVLLESKSAEPIDAGDYTVRVSARGSAETSVPATDVMHISLPAAPGSVGVLLARRGPGTVNREAPTADLRFRRSEQLRIEVPAPFVNVALPWTGRLLDRTGKPLPVPVTTAVRDDPDGSRWLTAQLTLAPLAVGDYIIELTRAGGAGEAGGAGKGGGAIDERTLVGFRVIP